MRKILKSYFGAPGPFGAGVGATLSVGATLGATTYASDVSMTAAGRTRPTFTAAQLAAILADATNNRAEFDFIPVSVANHSLFFSFSYLVI